MPDRTQIDKYSPLGEFQSEITKLKRLATKLNRANPEDVEKILESMSLGIDELIMAYLGLKSGA